MRVKFDTVRTFRRVNTKCSRCGARIRRQRTFTATVNPFNTGADGRPKPRSVVFTDLSEKADAWAKGPMLCGACKAPDPR